MIDQSIDTGDAAGRLLFSMLGAITQFETEIRAERQMDGICNAKARGVDLGGRKSLTKQEYLELRQKRGQGVLIKTLMNKYSLSKVSVYRYLDGA